MTGLLLHIYKVWVSYGQVEITTFFIKRKKDTRIAWPPITRGHSQQPEPHAGGGKV